MKVSIVVPIYNVGLQFLVPCLDSIAKQTLRRDEYEIILVDDCSTEDATTSYVNAFAETTPNAHIVRHKVNMGLNEARRSGVAASKADYVVFVDGDDMLTRDAIENLWIEAYKTSAELVTAPFWSWDPVERRVLALTVTWRALGSSYIERLRNVLAVERSFTMCGRLFRRELLETAIFDLPQRLYHEDVVTLVRFMLEARSVAHITRPIYFYTINTSSITKNFTKKHAEDIIWALEDWIRQTEKHSILDDLTTSISAGAEKLFDMCVRRCAASQVLNSDEKATTLEFIRNSYLAFPIREDSPSADALRTSFSAASQNEHEGAEDQVDLILKTIELQPIAKPLVKPPVEPSEFARRLKDKVVFICQVDYQLRNAAEFARELRELGHPCVVLDNSGFASGGLRQLPPEERNIFWRTEYIKIAKPPYGRDWLSTAKLVVTFNDFNDDFREALEYRYRLQLSAACVIEGINDFLRVDAKHPRHLPYRRCDHVLLAGEDDRGYFDDRSQYIVGLPIIEKLVKKNPTFPTRPLAALNVNFTYGILENSRDLFIRTARRAFLEAGFDWRITQHPADKGDLTGLPVSDRSQYELIDECTVFVSRFATGILEALASGKPAIYFNPHGENVEKFAADPLGAFEIACSQEELVLALQRVLKDMEAGVDFRRRALPFLKRHTAYASDSCSASERLANAAVSIMNSEVQLQDESTDHFFTRLNKVEPFRTENEESIFGDFERRHKAQLNDEEMVARYFGDRGAIMIDVGANFGNSCDVYLGKGWTVHAFEPDPNNRRVLLETWGSNPRLIVNENAVSDKAGLIVPFYASDESTGISGLSAFTKGHRKIAEVTTTTLRDYYRESGLKHADFLKIDVEGFDKFVLDGFPWEEDLPEVVLAEFEDSKTLPLGYSIHDLAATMQNQGYTVYVSEWHPIIRYGIAHDWRRLIEYSEHLDLAATWGNLIGFKVPPDRQTLNSLARQTIKFAARPGMGQIAAASGEVDVGKQALVQPPYYAPFGAWLMKRSPRAFMAARLAKRALAGLWRRKIWTAPALIMIAAVAAAGFAPELREYRVILWSGAAFATLGFAILYVALRVYQFAGALSAQYATMAAELTALRRALDIERHARLNVRNELSNQAAQRPGDMNRDALRML